MHQKELKETEAETETNIANLKKLKQNVIVN
jgi:hypothetical protein